MRVVLVSANLGNSNSPIRWAHQDLREGTVDFVRFDDESYPPRAAMGPRLQAKIPKMFAWEMLPGYDIYIWIDASFRIWRFSTAQWFVDHLGDGEFAAFPHPNRTSIRAEAELLRASIAADPYLRIRYGGELVDEQLAAIPPDYPDDRLFCGGLIAYRPTPRVKAAMCDWWFHTSRYHVIDQLSLPYVLWKNKVDVRALPGRFYKEGPMLFRPKVRHDG